jgi:membrane protein implicated in regulation of membrane protease activity
LIVLRAIVIAAGAILVCVGVGLIACGRAFHPFGWQALIVGVIILIGTLFERWRYRRIEEPPQGDWQRTGEQFIDPSTGNPVEVMFNPRTGERRYVDGKSRGTGPEP